MIIQIPFAIFNLYFAYNKPESSCMDNPHNDYVLRPWLMTMGKWQLIVVIGIGLPLILKRMGCLRLEEMVCLWGCAACIAIITGFVWRVVEILLFFNVIKDNCDGSVYAYGFILAVFDIFFFFKCCCGCCEGRRGRN